MKKNTSSIEIAQILPKIVKRNGWEKELERYEVFRDWAGLVGDDLAKNSAPLKVERNVLWIEVENSQWLQQMQMQKIWILEDINARLALSTIADLRLMAKVNERKKKKTDEPKVRYEPPSPEEFEEFCKKTEWIEDESCREALREFWYLYHARKED